MLKSIDFTPCISAIRAIADRHAQLDSWFLEINPNGRIPAITDTFSDGQKIRLFESGSILQYLAEQYDKDYKISYPKGTREYYETNNWLWFQNAGVGPMQGAYRTFCLSGEDSQTGAFCFDS